MLPPSKKLTLRALSLSPLATATAICWAQAEPLQSFEAIVGACRESLSQTTTEIRDLKNIGKWAKVVIKPEGNVEYDVKRTDSLVSPYAGVIMFTTLSVADRADSSEEAQRLVLSFDTGRVSRERTVLRFAYQSGAWVPQEGSQTYEFRRSVAESFGPPTSIRLLKEEYTKQWSQASRCLQSVPSTALKR